MFVGGSRVSMRVYIRPIRAGGQYVCAQAECMRAKKTVVSRGALKQWRKAKQGNIFLASAEIKPIKHHT